MMACIRTVGICLTWWTCCWVGPLPGSAHRITVIGTNLALGVVKHNFKREPAHAAGRSATQWTREDYRGARATSSIWSHSLVVPTLPSPRARCYTPPPALAQMTLDVWSGAEYKMRWFYQDAPHSDSQHNSRSEMGIIVSCIEGIIFGLYRRVRRGHNRLVLPAV